MGIELFTDEIDDQAYLSWLREHPNGFVLVPDSVKSQDAIVHSAQCPSISRPKRRNPAMYTGKRRVKYCAESWDDVNAFKARPGMTVTGCQMCEKRRGLARRRFFVPHEQDPLDQSLNDGAKEDTITAVTVDESGIVQKVRRIPVGRPPSSEPFVTCSKCGARVQRSDIREHHRSAHLTAAEDDTEDWAFLHISSRKKASTKQGAAPSSRSQGHRSPATRPPKLTPLATCPYCVARVAKDKLQQHIERAHKKNTTLPESPVLAAEKTATPDSRILTKCPFCQAYVKQTRLKKHVQKVHGAKDSAESKALPQLTRQLSKGPRLVICPECGVSVARTNLQKHRQKVHNATAARPISVEKVPQREVVIGKRTMVQCRLCGASVRKDRLHGHMRKVHGSPGYEEQAAPLAQKTPPQPKGTRHGGAKRQRGTVPSRVSDSDRLQLEALKQSMDEPRDGSKHWGHMRREHGRFGSHPIFDDYDDESEP
jgi:uncharacterized C2H2 Zn-finger protein